MQVGQVLNHDCGFHLVLQIDLTSFSDFDILLFDNHNLDFKMITVLELLSVSGKMQ